MELRRIFVSHNTKWQFIDDFANLIRELGYYPVVVEKEPDLGMDPNDKSRYYMESSDMVVFVITKDAVDSSGRPHPKSNVAMEIGLAGDKFKPEKKIFLVEEDAQPPSMVTKTYIRIEQGNYYAAVAHLIRNIRSVLPCMEPEELPTVELDEMEECIVSELAKHAHGEEARPVLLELLAKRFSIDEKRFNIIRFRLKDREVIREGQIGIGHDHSGDIYLKLTGLGWRLASELEGMRGNS